MLRSSHMGGMGTDIYTPGIEALGLLEDDEIELDEAALALSALDHDGLDLAAYHDLLDDIDDALDAFAEASTPTEQGAALAQVFHGEFGFTGDAESYDAPLNADLIRVLDRRRGLPVSLALLYVSAARRIGWDAWPTGTPGHVLVRIGEDPMALIDPFHDGVPVSPERLAALLRGALGPDAEPDLAHIAPMSNRDTLARLLLNQATRAERTGDPVRALSLFERMTLVAPHNPDGWWEQARLQLQLDDVDAARHSLGAMLEVTRDPRRRQLAFATLEALARA